MKEKNTKKVREKNNGLRIKERKAASKGKRKHQEPWSKKLREGRR